MNIFHLKVLCVVADEGSLTGAAKKLSYTTSAVSQQILLLERETKSVLLERLPRGVRLTESGRVLVGHARRILAEQESAHRSLRAIASARGGLLRFGSVPEISATLVPTVLARFGKDFPGVELDFRVGSRDSLLELLVAGELDIVTFCDPAEFPAPRPHSIEWSRLLADQLCVLLPADHPLACSDQLGLVEVLAENWIQGVDQAAEIEALSRMAESMGAEPNVVFKFDDQLTVQAMVAVGMGIAFASSLSLPGTRPDITAVPLSEPALLRYAYVASPCPPNRTPSAGRLGHYLRRAALDVAVRRPGLTAMDLPVSQAGLVKRSA